MRFLIILSLFVVGLIAIGMVMPFGSSSACLNCEQSDTSLKESYRSLKEPLQITGTSGAVLFTERGNPVTLVTPNWRTKAINEVSYTRLMDATGQIVSAGDLRVIPMLEQRQSHASKAAAVVIQPKSVLEPSLVVAPNIGVSQDFQPSLTMVESASKRTLESKSYKAIEEATYEPSSMRAKVAVNRWEERSDINTVSPRLTLDRYQRAVASSPRLANTSDFYGAAVSQPRAYSRLSNSLPKPALAMNTVPQFRSKSASVLRTTPSSKLVVRTGSKSKSSLLAPQNFKAKQQTKIAFAEETEVVSSSTSDDLEDSIGDVSDDLDDLSDDVKDLSSDLDDVKDSLTVVEDQVGTLQGQVGDVNVADLSSQFDDLGSQFSVLEQKTYAGIASTASLVTAIPSDPGKTIINVGYGHYEGQNAVGLSVSKRLSKINGYVYSGVASGLSDVKTPLLRVGVGIEF